jgi:hypothetical protein
MHKASSIAVLALVGCNQLFGSEHVQRTDAAYFDAPPDSPFSCPPTGTVPAFSRQFRQILAQNCSGYTVSTVTGQTAAMCRDGLHLPAVATGSLDGKLVVQSALTSANGALYEPRIAADGDRISALEMTPLGDAIALFHRATGTWVRDPDIASAPSIVAASEISRGPRARILVAYAPEDVRELEDQGDGRWLEVGTQRATFGSVSYDEGIHLSGDALRSWYDAGGPLLFDRPDRDSAFTQRARLGGTNGIADAFMTDDCGALYFAALSSIWLAERD